MKALESAWQHIFSDLEIFRGLPAGARRFFVEAIRPSQAISNEEMGEWYQTLTGSGLLIPGPQHKNAKVAPEFQTLGRTLRMFRRNQILDAPSRQTFSLFLTDEFSWDNIKAFTSPNMVYGYGPDHSAAQKLYSLVSSGEWLKSFLEAEDADWETNHRRPISICYFHSPEVFQAAQAMVRALVAAAAPVPIEQLPKLLPDFGPLALGEALRAGIRYLLFYPAIQRDPYEAVVGAWPGIARRLNRTSRPRPASVEVPQPLSTAFLLDDMTTVLSAAAVEPLPVRSYDYVLYEATARDLLAALGTLPQEIEKSFRCTLSRRLSESVIFLQNFEFLNLGSEEVDFRTSRRLAATAAGVKWLGLSRTARLKEVFRCLSGDLRRAATLYNGPSLPLVPSLSESRASAETEKIKAAVLDSFKELRPGVFANLSAFLGYSADRKNPLLEAKNRPFFYFAGRSYDEPSADELEDAWQDVLRRFLEERLLPLGGVQIGHDSGGELCLAITPAGRHLLGTGENFELDADSAGQVVVQPNFDVVFLAPSPRAEAEIARFGERAGHRVGTLFKITKQSILNAAAGGLTRERVLETLSEHCTSALPANVKREITGWFGQYRQVALRPAVLIHCPDEHTAVQVMSTAGKHVTRLNPTTLELHAAKMPPALVKKLRAAGIFVRTRSEVAEEEE